ncbi:octopamine receptor beta-1R-like [Stylophora pistillata]|uniref:octopamine receptor beta-1R-like n=1 Tax=Stylophora pistillata TaxID=50429 RepID=UPI000C052ED9|nr:octopamine receptor beta-1R-like [Stylophora pistillata]
MWFFIFGWFFTAFVVLGNVLVIYLIITRPRLHVATNWFILSLALADFCFGLSYFPIIFTSYFDAEISTDHTGLWFKISHTFLYSSCVNLCALITDKFATVMKPLTYASYMTQKRLLSTIALAWISPLLLFTLPSIFTYSGRNELFTFVFETFRVLIFQLVPSVMFVLITGRLFLIAINISHQEKLLLAQLKFNFCEEPQQSVKRIKEKKASMKMIFLIILFFVLCHLGGNYRCFCFTFKMCVASETLKKVIHICFIINSALNPLVYAILKKDVKQELKKVAMAKKQSLVKAFNQNSPDRSLN